MQGLKMNWLIGILLAIGVAGPIYALANEPPVLDPIEDQFVDPETAPLQLVVTATDPEQQPLTFGLDTAPLGATIDPMSGQFHWMPEPEQYPGWYVVEVWVQDSGQPPLTDSGTFTIQADWPVGYEFGKRCAGNSKPNCRCTKEGAKNGSWCQTSQGGTACSGMVPNWNCPRW